jgi:hypothetical protein
MWTLHGCFSGTRIVKLVFWLENYSPCTSVQGLQTSTFFNDNGCHLPRAGNPIRDNHEDSQNFLTGLSRSAYSDR